MIDKQSKSEFYSPSIKELQYAQRNSKGLISLLLAALGAGTAAHSAKALFENMAAARLSNEIQPSVDLQRRLRLSKNKIDNEFLYNTDAEKHPFTAEELLELQRLAEEKAKNKEKDASYLLKQAVEIPLNIEIGSKPKSSIPQSGLEKMLLNIQNGKFKGPPVSLDLNKVLLSDDKQLADKLHYIPDTLETSSKWTKYISNPLAKMGPQSTLPLALLAGGGIIAAPLLAKHLVKGIRDKLLPRPKRESKFLDAAKEIYEDAAKELQEVGYKKEKDDLKHKKEASVKEAKRKGGPTVSAQNSDGNHILSLANLPTNLAAALLAIAAYKGVKGFDTGMSRAEKDVSHKTQFLRGWRAMNKLRDYNYNPITVELAEEPGLKTRTMREKDERIRALLEDLRDSDEIEYNPIEIQRLTEDAADAKFV